MEANNKSNPENNGKRKAKKTPPGKKSKKTSAKGVSSAPKSQESSVDPGNSFPQEDPLELAFPDGLETLLPIKNRKPIPDLPQSKGPKCKLVEIVQFAPALYQKMIGKLRIGVSPNVAAELIGISEPRFYQWAEMGAKDFAQDIDSYYSRFYRDVRRAIAVKTGECEETLAKRDPKIWLSRGPGKVFGNRWAKNPEKPALPNQGSKGFNGQQALPPPVDQDDIIDATFTVTHKEDIDGEGNPNQATNPGTGSSANGIATAATLNLSPEQEYETLKVLDGIGQIQLSDSLKKAFEDQISSDQVEPEVEDEDDG